MGRYYNYTSKKRLIPETPSDASVQTCAYNSQGYGQTWSFASIRVVYNKLFYIYSAGSNPIVKWRIMGAS